MKKIHNLLIEFGLTSNAAKAYTALLKHNPSTGYEISSQTDIPRSAIYNVLNKLVGLGFANSVGDSPKRYIPLPPSTLVEHLDQSHNEKLDDLEEAFNSIEVDDESFDFWHLHGYRNIMLKTKELINNAKKKIVISGWKREIEEIEKELVAANKRGIESTIFSFTKVDEKLGRVVSYNLEEKDLRKIWTPKIIMVVDYKHTVMGSAKNTENSRAILTQNTAINEIATNHIILDITLAGQRLDFDPKPFVKNIMHNSAEDLQGLLKS
jgi:sugar-specific transcriptional regulator TrmB